MFLLKLFSKKLYLEQETFKKSIDKTFKSHSRNFFLKSFNKNYKSNNKIKTNQLSFL